MKLTESQLRRIIREELGNESRYFVEFITNGIVQVTREILASDIADLAMQIDDIAANIEASLKRKINDPNLRPEEWETAGVVFAFDGETNRELIRSINKELDNFYIAGRK